MDTNIFEKSYFIGAGETDPSGYCRPSALQTFLQDAATIHAERLGLSREALLARAGLFWVLVRSWYTLSRPILSKETLLVRTWPRGARGAQIYRDFDIEIDGIRVGEAVTSWVLVNWETRRMVRPSVIPEAANAYAPGRAKDIHLDKLPPADILNEAGGRRAVYSDLDVNNHVNNVRYTDYVCDALGMENSPGVWIPSLQLGFTAQVQAGEILRLYNGELPDGRFYVTGRGEDGSARFEAAGELADNS